MLSSLGTSRFRLVRLRACCLKDTYQFISVRPKLGLFTFTLFVLLLRSVLSKTRSAELQAAASKALLSQYSHPHLPSGKLQQQQEQHQRRHQQHNNKCRELCFTLPSLIFGKTRDVCPLQSEPGASWRLGSQILVSRPKSSCATWVRGNRSPSRSFLDHRLPGAAFLRYVASEMVSSSR